FARIENRQRLARLCCHGQLRLRAGLRRLEAGEENGEPGTLLRCRAGDDAIQCVNVFRRERCVLRKQRLGGHKRLLDILHLRGRGDCHLRFAVYLGCCAMASAPDFAAAPSRASWPPYTSTLSGRDSPALVQSRPTKITAGP